MILLDPIAISPDIVPPAFGSLVAMLAVTVAEKSSSSLRASASSPRVLSPAPASPTSVEISSSTYFLVAASRSLEGAVRLVIVADVPAFMFNVPSMVTLLNEDEPAEVTLPVRSPVTSPSTLPVTSPVTLPVTLPVRSPVIPPEDVTVVNAPLEAVVAPTVAPSTEPPPMLAVARVALPVDCRVVNLPVV